MDGNRDKELDSVCSRARNLSASQKAKLINTIMVGMSNHDNDADTINESIHIMNMLYASMISMVPDEGLRQELLDQSMDNIREYISILCFDLSIYQ